MMASTKSYAGLLVILGLICACSSLETPLVDIENPSHIVIMDNLPEVQTYNYKNCFLLRIAAKFESFKNQTTVFGNGRVNEAESECENSSKFPILTIDFDQGSIYFMIRMFEDGTSGINEIGGTRKVNGTDVAFLAYKAESQFQLVPAGHYYKCDSEQKVKVKYGDHLIFSNFSYEVARDASISDFYQIPELCALDKSKVPSVSLSDLLW